MKNIVYLFCTGDCNKPEYFSENIYITFEKANESFIEFMYMTEPDDQFSWCRIDEIEVEENYYHYILEDPYSTIDKSKIISRKQVENCYADYSNFRDVLKEMGLYELYYEDIDLQYQESQELEL